METVGADNPESVVEGHIVMTNNVHNLIVGEDFTIPVSI